MVVTLSRAQVDVLAAARASRVNPGAPQVSGLRRLGLLDGGGAPTSVGHLVLHRISRRAGGR